MNRCTECGSREITREEITHRLDDLIDVPAVEYRCQSCGESAVGIKDFESLYRSIAQDFIRQPSRLSGRQLAWLRKYMGFSSEDLAERLDVRRETISAWENSKRPVPKATELALRLMVQQGERISDYLPSEEASSAKMVYSFRRDSAQRWARA